MRPNFNNNWQKLAQKFVTKIFYCTFSDDFGVAGLRPNFFLQRPNFLAELAQESCRDLAAVEPSPTCTQHTRLLHLQRSAPSERYAADQHPSGGCWRSTPSGRSRGSSVRSGRSQQVVDSDEPKSKKILLRMSQYFVDAYSLICVCVTLPFLLLVTRRSLDGPG